MPKRWRRGVAYHHLSNNLAPRHRGAVDAEDEQRHLPDMPPSPEQVIAMAEIFGCPPMPLLILTGWLPKLDTSLPVAGPKRWRRSTLYQRDGQPGWASTTTPTRPRSRR